MGSTNTIAAITATIMTPAIDKPIIFAFKLFLKSFKTSKNLM
jgi:hypothetical protein